EQLATAAENERWAMERSKTVYKHLVTVGASGESIVLSGKMRLSAKERFKLVRARIDEWLGKDKGVVEMQADGCILVRKLGLVIDNLQPLRGLPINDLDSCGSNVTALCPLRGMPLTRILFSNTKISSLEPLRGM